MTTKRCAILFVFLTLLTILSTTLSSCGFYFRTRLYEEHDLVKSTLRFRQEYYFNEVTERRTPFLNLHKTMLKEVAADGQEVIKVYDRLNLTIDSFRPESSAYLIVDGQVFPFESLEPEQNIQTHISEDRKDVLTADSTRVSVVTGYSTTQSRQVRYQYVITPELMNKIQHARTLSFRYYAGPSMMTVKVGPKNLKNIIKLIRA